MTPSGIESATFQFVAQLLNHCANAVPLHLLKLGTNKCRSLYPRERHPVPPNEAMWVPGLLCKVVKKKENFVPSSEFEPRTVQPVASRYNDYTVTVPCK